MASAAELTQRAADLVPFMDDTMTWNGTDYLGAFTVLGVTDGIEIGGYKPEYDGSFFALNSSFSTLPTVEAQVTIQGRTFEIIGFNRHPDAVCIEFQLKGLAQA